VDPMQTAPYLAAKAEREAAAHRVIVARRQAVPDVTASVGVRRLEVDKANAIIAGITVPFPLFDRNRGNIAAAQAELRGAEARANATLLELEAKSAPLSPSTKRRTRVSQRPNRRCERQTRPTGLLASPTSPASRPDRTHRGKARAGTCARGRSRRCRCPPRCPRQSRRLQGLTITGEPVQ
jgi:cobalt-zinc-cadmium efflux system outer membrane protein